MENIHEAVADNIRQIRKQRKISLDALAAMTGVSKSMLAQIERGANPSISTVWKIANGLKIPFTQLVSVPQKDLEVVRLDSISALLEDEGRYRNYPLFPYENLRPFEIYSIELDAGAQLQAAAHPVGTQEYIVVACGAVRVFVNGQTLDANCETALRFRADLPHRYENRGEEMCRLTMIIQYTQEL